MSFSLTVQFEFLLRILIAAFCGACIGYERKAQLKSSGIRTHLIVSLAAALMTILSKYGFDDILGKNAVGLDPSRIAAGVVTAVGFLGAGVIFVRNQNISGLSTSAGIWATVGVGMSIGAGMYFLGAAVSILIILIQFLLHRTSRWDKTEIEEQITVRVQDKSTVPGLIRDLSEKKIDIISVSVRRKPNGAINVQLSVKFPPSYALTDVMELLEDMQDIISVDI